MSDELVNFDAAFRALNPGGFDPFPWQRRLYNRMCAGDWPDACDIPTGLGKTSAVICWLLALANEKPNSVPRRLVYVVNRRTIVDQVTEVAKGILQRFRGDVPPRDATAAAALERLRARLRAVAGLEADTGDLPLTISTLRGELADNAAWRRDPARPAIIVATPDLAGSSMLFRAYRAGWKSRAFYAGLLGYDALVLHDEAHLTRPFQALLRRVRALQESHDAGAPRNVRVMALSATGDDEVGPVLRLDEEDFADPVAIARLRAKKTLHLHDSSKLLDDIVAKATSFADEPVKVLVYLRSPKDAAAVKKRIAATTKENPVELLTGTIRGHERDCLTKSSAMRRLLRDDVDLPPLDRAIYLVSTSAGEVGADFDADHLVCDLTPADSLVQRLGRVNRRGAFESGSLVHVFAGGKTADALKNATEATRQMLIDVGASSTTGIAADPLATRGWVTDRTRPESSPLAHLTDAGLSALAMTSVRGDWSLVPAVPALIHGLEDDAPQTTVLWREEAGLLSHVTEEEIEAIYSTHRPLAHERLTAPSSAVATFLTARLAHWQQEQRTADRPDAPPHAVLQDANGRFRCKPIDDPDLLRDLPHATLILPASFGGLDASGSLDETKPTPTAGSLDIADRRPTDGNDLEVSDERARALLTRTPADTWAFRRLATGSSDFKEFESKHEARSEAAEGMRVEREIVIATDGDDAQQVLLLLRPRRKGKSRGGVAIGYDEHVARVTCYAERSAAALLPDFRDLYRAAATHHDSGKRCDPWQQAAGRRDGEDFLAKPAGAAGLKSALLSGYRHEFGSAWDFILGNTDRFDNKNRDLLLHLVLSHHARGRPTFDPRAFLHPQYRDELPTELRPAAIAKRFVQLQHRYGPWRLAWLEAILIAADRAASADEEGANDGAK